MITCVRIGEERAAPSRLLLSRRLFTTAKTFKYASFCEFCDVTVLIFILIVGTFLAKARAEFSQQTHVRNPAIFHKAYQ